ncbi:hypothetical protein AHFPHNDE_01869 [Pseudomonas sp. MM227]|uniref:hypothetical protein n=1 Tax=Pseudomonas sp. MM227 TaxID=3019968 RepID=UPI00221EE8EE|nr:hypothetical protein [Pseudomonas sp. MM227]CAI3788196.1 hypothetical protein AHFPHNDE_01869 [Pseudomonas sp. MM227]
MKRTVIFMTLMVLGHSSAQAVEPETPTFNSSSINWISNVDAPAELKARWVQEWRKAIDEMPMDEKKISSLAAEVSTFMADALKTRAASQHKTSANPNPKANVPSKTGTGEELAAKLNARFNHVVPDCESKAAYRCSGIVLRSNEHGGTVPTWVPAGTSALKDILPMTYIRQDITSAATSIWAYQTMGFGILLNAADEVAYSTRCIFPINGYSNSNADNGCGVIEQPQSDVDNSNCAALGVTTAAQWMEKTTYIFPYCSFSTHSPAPFMEAVKAQNLWHTQREPEEWNELIVNASPENWDAENPANDPIEALWYHKRAKQSDHYLTGRWGAQHEQLLIFEMTGKAIPVISIDDTKPDAPFGYAAEDQLVWSSSGAEPSR